MEKTKFNQVIEILEGQGWTEDQIADLTFELSKAAFARLYAEAALYFTDEDLNQIEACQNQEEADKKIKELYRLRVGKDPEEKSQELFNVFADGFLEDYQRSHHEGPNATEAVFD